MYFWGPCYSRSPVSDKDLEPRHWEHRLLGATEGLLGVMKLYSVAQGALGRLIGTWDAGASVISHDANMAIPSSTLNRHPKDEGHLT